MRDRELIPLGTITKPQGLKGAFRVHPLSGESESLPELTTLHVVARNGESTAWTVRRVQDRGAFYVMELEGLDRIEQVEPLIGAQVCAERSLLKPLEQGEHYWFELVGMNVVTINGRELGRVESILPTGANDVLVVNRGKNEKLIPYIDDVIVDVDVESQTITIDPPPGLLD